MCPDTLAPVPKCLADNSVLVPKCPGSEVSVHRIHNGYVHDDVNHITNLKPVATIKTSRVTQPITDAADATGRDRS